MPNAVIRLLLSLSLLLAACGTGQQVNEAEFQPSTPTSRATTTLPPRMGEAPCHQAEVLHSNGSLAFYAMCGGSLAPYPVYRPIHTEPSLGQSLGALVAGTTAEERVFGLSTGFDFVGETGDIEVRADVDADGIAHLDFLINGTRWDPGTLAGTSSQLFSFLDPLHATVFQHSEVRGLHLSTLCWGESACQGIMTRQGWESLLFGNAGVLSQGGCTPEAAWLRPGRCTVEGALDGPIRPARVVNVSADDTLSLRSGPGVEYSRIGELDPAATVEVTEEAARAADSGIWRLVHHGSKGTGWVNAAYLDIPRTDEEALVHAFVEFARDPADHSFARLPLADEVGLGLGPEIVRVVPARTLRRPSAWELEREVFRAYVGPFSTLDLLRDLVVYDVSVGAHPHCASPPMPPPDGLEDLTRISAQPRPRPLGGSCLQWFTVDFFLNDEGLVEATTLDVWEP